MSDSPDAHEPAAQGPDNLGLESAVHENEDTKPATHRPECPLAEIPESAPHANLQFSQAVTKRTWPNKCKRSLTKYKRAAILGLIGLIAGAVAFSLYPRVPEAPTPGYSQLVIRSDVPIGLIEYAVSPVQSVTKIEVRVQLAPGVYDGDATVQLWPPHGIALGDCYLPACHDALGLGSPGAYSTERLIFRTAGASSAATVYFEVKADNFGAISNDVSASAVIPEVTYSGPQSREFSLLTYYEIPAAASYDWPSFQPEGFQDGRVIWAEDLSSNDTQSRVAVGINYSAQTRDDFMIFLAGALVGLMGGALIGAVQEFWNARDKEPMAKEKSPGAPRD